MARLPPISPADTPDSAPRYEIRIAGRGPGNGEYEIWQLPAKATPRVAASARIAGLRGRNLELVEHRVLRRLAQAGVRLVPTLQSRYGSADQDLARLELLVDFRNAVVHGNESEVHALTRKRPIATTLRSYHLFRRTCDRLVRRLDTVVAAELAAELQISQPW